MIIACPVLLLECKIFRAHAVVLKVHSVHYAEIRKALTEG